MEIYHERCGWPLWFRLAMATLLLGILLLGAISGETGGLIVMIAIFALLAAVFYRLSWVEFRIGEEGVDYGFRGLRHHVPWRRVHGVEAEPYRLRRYLGWGYRIGGRRDRAYSVLGPAGGIRLRFEDERGREWSIFLSSRDPASALRAAKRKVS